MTIIKMSSYLVKEDPRQMFKEKYWRMASQLKDIPTLSPRPEKDSNPRCERHLKLHLKW